MARARGGGNLPSWTDVYNRCGFNFLWFFSGRPGDAPAPVDEKALDFCAEHGFDFIRLPTSYWFWTQDFDYDHPDEKVLAQIDRAIEACRQRKLYVSLNVHRAPGYCINGADLEKHNLWLDPVAQDAFEAIWTRWAERYRPIPGEELSFDLLNEPPSPGERGMTRDNHEALMRRVVGAIRAVDPARPVTLDGIGGGHIAIPELADLGVTHSGRGYAPMTVSHWNANWWLGWQEYPKPSWPGAQWMDKTWDKEVLRAFYQPWKDVEAQGVKVHIGEFGCYNGVDNSVALAWLGDIMSLWKEWGWGWGMWQFEGAFGIINHGRPGAVYENYKGYQVDRALLDLLLENRPS